MTDLFPGFESHTVDIGGLSLFARIGGPRSAPPVVLLHGFPQSHACWHHVAPGLAEHYRVVCLDLKGYGRSDAPEPESPTTYSKRTMAREVVQFMAALGHSTFSVVGHDRGALVGYRMALDSPETVRTLAILDNYPTPVIWDSMAADPSFTPHWRTFAADDGTAEAAMKPHLLEELAAAHTESGTTDVLGIDALEDYRPTWSDPARIRAFAADYRAGSTVDPDLDRADLEAGIKVTCPTLVVWGEAFLGRAPESPTSIWRRTFTPGAVGVEVPGGHFNAEESPTETTEALLQFWSRHSA